MPLVHRQIASTGDTVERQIDAAVVSARTPYQSVSLWQSASHGTWAVIDGDVQSTATDRATYHEALVQPAMICHPQPRTVLVCGGGEGATIREVLRHPSVERVVMCDLDEAFVDLCRRELPSWSAGAFEDPRLEPRYEDIVAYVASTELKFDVVIGDLVDIAGYDEDSPVAGLYGETFYRTVAACMTEDGVLATQASALTRGGADAHKRIRASLAAVFARVDSYRATIETFYEPWGFVVAAGFVVPGGSVPADSVVPANGATVAGPVGRSLSDWQALFASRLGERGVQLEAFDAESLAAMFALPPPLRALLDQES